MDREKVIGNLTSLRERLKWQKDIQGYGFYIDFIDEAIDLLKEQEAVVPNRGLAKTQTAWFCGSCGFRLNRAGRFCSKCGQAVKWE